MYYPTLVIRCSECSATSFKCGSVIGLCADCSEQAIADWQQLQTPWRMRLAAWLRTMADRIDGGPNPAWRR